MCPAGIGELDTRPAVASSPANGFDNESGVQAMFEFAAMPASGCASGRLELMPLAA